jgi:hypothetical protein
MSYVIRVSGWVLRIPGIDESPHGPFFKAWPCVVLWHDESPHCQPAHELWLIW